MLHLQAIYDSWLEYKYEEGLPSLVETMKLKIQQSTKPNCIPFRTTEMLYKHLLDDQWKQYLIITQNLFMNTRPCYYFQRKLYSQIHVTVKKFLSFFHPIYLRKTSDEDQNISCQTNWRWLPAELSNFIPVLGDRIQRTRKIYRLYFYSFSLKHDLVYEYGVASVSTQVSTVFAQSSKIC